MTGHVYEQKDKQYFYRIVDDTVAHDDWKEHWKSFLFVYFISNLSKSVAISNVIFFLDFIVFL